MIKNQKPLHYRSHDQINVSLILLKVTADPQDLPVTKSSESYIWPVCLPKDDDDEEFSSAGEMDQSKASIQVT